MQTAHFHVSLKGEAVSSRLHGFFSACARGKKKQLEIKYGRTERNDAALLTLGCSVIENGTAFGSHLLLFRHVGQCVDLHDVWRRVQAALT